MFNDDVVIDGFLYPIPKQEQRPNGPVMRGMFRVIGEHGRFDGAAWPREAVSGQHAGSTFFSVQLEPLDANGKKVRVFGTIFPSGQKSSHDSPDYFGKLKLTEADDGPTLRISCWDRQSSAQPPVPFISVRIEPHKRQEANRGNAGGAHPRRTSQPESVAT